LAGASSVPHTKACARSQVGSVNKRPKAAKTALSLGGWGKHKWDSRGGESSSLLPRRPVKNWIKPSLEAEADELCSFVGKKVNKRWLWLALDADSRQILAFHVGDRSRKSARQLWNKLPALYRQHATFHTDAYAPYGRVIPKARHRAITKAARKTNHVERFNGTLRQRLSRLVQSTLSFSKKLTNHIGAIRYFLCHYNLTRAARCRTSSLSP
jgi:IS1 family transposase